MFASVILTACCAILIIDCIPNQLLMQYRKLGGRRQKDLNQLGLSADWNSNDCYIALRCLENVCLLEHSLHFQPIVGSGNQAGKSPCGN